MTDGIAGYLERIGPFRFAVLFTILLCSLLYVVLGLVTSLWVDPPGLVNSAGKWVGRDFVAFYSASVLSLAGSPAAAYDPAVIQVVENETIGAPVGLSTWQYPPTFLLVVTPLALMPYLVALGLWLAVPLIAFAWLIHRIAPHPLTPWLVPMFPAAAQCLISGQNGLISAFFLGVALLNLERRPLLAGTFLGLLTYKPHLAVLIVPALMVGRHWRALAAMAASALVFAALGLLAFGPETWSAFVEGLGFSAQVLETGRIPWERQVSVFSTARLAGAGVAQAWILQVIAALCALAAVCWIWWRRAPLPLKGSALAAAIPLATPYAYDYDLTILALALAWLTWEGLGKGWLRGEVALLTTAWIIPVVGWRFALWSGVQLTPLVLVLLLAMIWRRAFPASARRPPATAA